MGLLARINGWNPLPSCAATHALGIDGMGLGFVACSSDCYAASITDAALALHCAVWALRVWRMTGPSGAMRLAVLSTLICNSFWSVFGTLVWLQPGGSRAPPFDLLFRLNGVAQSCLVFSWWCVLSESLRGLASVPVGVPGLIKLLAAVHAGFFCLRNLETEIEAYVLCGGAHVTPPLGSLWLLFVLLCRRHGLLSRWLADISPSNPPHPILVGALCGLVFWVGNSAILVGANSGLTYWSHYFVQALWRRVGLLSPGAELHQGAFEEMACFHFYGMLGNEMLFRAFTWLVTTEARAVARSPHQARSRYTGEVVEASRADRPPTAKRMGATAAPSGAPASILGVSKGSARCNGGSRVACDTSTVAPLISPVGGSVQAAPAKPSSCLNGAAAPHSMRPSISGGGANGDYSGAPARPHRLADSPSGIGGVAHGLAPSGIGGAAIRRWSSSPALLLGSHAWSLHPAGPWLTDALHAPVRGALAYGIKEE